MKRTRYPGVKQLGPQQFVLRVKTRCPKTGRLKDTERRVTAPDVVAAAELRSGLLRELRHDSGEPRARATVRAFARSWLASKLPALKPSTADRYARSLDLHVLPALGDYYLDAVTHADVVRWRDGLAGEPTSKNGHLRVVRNLFRDAAALGHVDRDPTLRVPAFREAAPSEEHWLTGPELAAILAAAREHEPAWHPIILTIAATGARFGEASALRWDDVDFERGAITIRRAQWKGDVDTTKTETSRVVPLLPELAEVLRAHRRRLVELQAPGLADGWCFPSQVGTLLSSAAVRTALRRAAARAVPAREELTLHDLRRTFNNAVRRVASGEVVRSMTGHATERMTEHYSHVDLSEKRAAVLRAVEGWSPIRSGNFGGNSDAED